MEFCNRFVSNPNRTKSNMFKGERKKFLKTHYLTYNAIIFGLKTFFSIIKLIFEGKVSFIYSVITLFSKITLIKVPYASIMPEFVSVSLNTPQYSRTLLNIPKYP